VEKEYLDLKALNPLLPVYIRPANNVAPFVAVRYERGVYNKRETSGLAAEQVAAQLKALVEQAPAVNAKLGSKDLSGGGSVQIAYLT